MSVVAYIGVGSNLARPVEQVGSGIAAVGEIPHTRVTGCSSLYRTAPIGNAAQPDFINGACRLETDLSPEALLDHLLAIERAHGRVRSGTTGGPRTLDLDLLWYDALSLQSTRLTLPHPRMHERAFVLYPLRDLEPDLMIPGRGRVRDLIDALAPQSIERLPAAASGHLKLTERAR